MYGYYVCVQDDEKSVRQRRKNLSESNTCSELSDCWHKVTSCHHGKVETSLPVRLTERSQGWKQRTKDNCSKILRYHWSQHEQQKKKRKRVTWAALVMLWENIAHHGSWVLKGSHSLFFVCFVCLFSSIETIWLMVSISCVTVWHLLVLVWRLKVPEDSKCLEMCECISANLQSKKHC